MQNVLIIHHVEPMWERSFGRYVEEYLESIVNYVEEQDYDHVILTS